MFTTSYKSQLAYLTTAPARMCAALKLSPNGLTVTGAIGTVLSCAYYLLIQRNTLLFCGLVLCWGLCDALDGALARLTGRSSRWGSYLDAMSDRLTEAAVALTVAQATGQWWLCSMVLAEALLISYAKARASMEVAVSNMEWPDLMERAERGLIFIGGLALSSVYPRRWGGHDVFWWTLVALAVMMGATILQRMWRAWHFMVTR